MRFHKVYAVAKLYERKLLFPYLPNPLDRQRFSHPLDQLLECDNEDVRLVRDRLEESESAFLMQN